MHTTSDPGKYEIRATGQHLIYYGLSELHLSYDIFDRCCLYEILQDEVRPGLEGKCLASKIRWSRTRTSDVFGVSHLSLGRGKVERGRVARDE
jgi:hypothetical protein